MYLQVSICTYFFFIMFTLTSYIPTPTAVHQPANVRASQSFQPRPTHDAWMSTWEPRCNPGEVCTGKLTARCVETPPVTAGLPRNMWIF